MVYGKYPRPPRYLRSAPGHLRYLEIFRDRTVARNPVLFRVAFPSFTKWIWYHRRKRDILLIIATQGLHAGTHFPRVSNPVSALLPCPGHRSEERRVGKECVSTFRSRWSLYHEKKKKHKT